MNINFLSDGLHAARTTTQEVTAMYNDRPLKVSICVTVDEDIIERLKQLSIADSRSFSQYINLVLRRHIEASENKKQ